MTVTSTLAHGTLTTSAAAIRTGTSTEHHDITFTNFSGSDVTVDLYLDGSGDSNRIGKAIPLEANGGFLAWKDVRMGSGNTIQAKASANSSVAWSDEITVLT